MEKKKKSSVGRLQLKIKWSGGFTAVVTWNNDEGAGGEVSAADTSQKSSQAEGATSAKAPSLYMKSGKEVGNSNCVGWV